MNIMVPVSSIENAINLCKAGSDELYIGIYDEIWNRKFGNFEEINRMSSFGKRANVSVEECIEIIRIVHNQKKKIYIAFNSGIYSKDEVNYILDMIENNNLTESDGFIISDLYLIQQMVKKNYNIILSTMAGVYNSNMIDFYYKMGIRRIIVPRDVSLQNIKNMVSKYKNIKFEVFLMRNGCKYSDAHCMSFHSRKYNSMCSCVDNNEKKVSFVNNLSSDYKKMFYANDELFTKVFHKKACGLCYINELMSIGVSTVKVVGRADDEKAVIEDIKLIRKIVDNYNKKDIACISEDSIFENCWYGLNCYY